MRPRPNPRKLLVASVGVATLNYLPAACAGATVANLVPPGRKQDAGADAADARPESSVPPSPTVANLVAPAPSSSTVPPSPTVANLVAPAPVPESPRARQKKGP
jgi:hypothetical protein